MSRSNQTELTTPCTRFLQWAGGEGKLRYYDKSTKSNFWVDLPFAFLVLDRLHTVTGFSDQLQTGYWSNEVRDVSHDALTVRTSNGIVAQGVWKQLPAIAGLKYAQSIYIAYKDESGNLQIGNIKASGAFVSAWIEFSKRRNIYDGAIVITGAEEARKGATKYFVPVFAAKAVSAESDAAAKALDVELQNYLAAYLSRQAAPQENEVVSFVSEQDDLPRPPVWDEELPVDEDFDEDFF